MQRPSLHVLLAVGSLAAVLGVEEPAHAHYLGMLGRSGADGQTCVECHSYSTVGAPNNLRASLQVMDGASAATMPLIHTKKYTLKLRLTLPQAGSNPASTWGGFNLAAANGTKRNYTGQFEVNAGDTNPRVDAALPVEATHSIRKVGTGSDASTFPYVEWLVDWTPPALAMGTADTSTKLYATVRRPYVPSNPPGSAAGQLMQGEVRALSSVSTGAVTALANECGPTAGGFNPAACGIAVTIAPSNCADADGDGWLPSACYANRFNNGGDCNDNNAMINPAALDACNGVDDDCDGMTDEGLTGTPYYPDVDGDTYGDKNTMARMACDATQAASAGVMNPVTNNMDCNDLSDMDKPGAMERCDGLDNNCVMGVDEGLMTTPFYPDADLDGFGKASAVAVGACSQAQAVAKGVANAVTDRTDCDDTKNTVKPGLAEVCDGLDNDCMGGVDNGLPLMPFYADSDNDGYGRFSNPSMACDAVQATAKGTAHATSDHTDCNDGVATINPAGTEVCDDVDQNCNGTKDEGFAFMLKPVGLPCDSGDDADLCENGTVTCTPDGTAAECTNDYSTPEVCDGMQMDNNCDGQLDRAVFTDLGDRCGALNTCGEGVKACKGDGTGTECVPKRWPAEICQNQIDDDCDGVTDETTDINYGGSHYNQACDTFNDADQCKNGLVKCVDNAPACVGDFYTPEYCGNGVDDDCDTETDEFPCDPVPTDAGVPDASDAGTVDAADAADAAEPPDAAEVPDAADAGRSDSGVMDGDGSVTGLDAGAAADAGGPVETCTDAQRGNCECCESSPLPNPAMGLVLLWLLQGKRRRK